MSADTTELARQISQNPRFIRDTGQYFRELAAQHGEDTAGIAWMQALLRLAAEKPAGRAKIPAHYHDGKGTACRLLITPTAKICHTTEIVWVTCRKCLKALAAGDLPETALSGGGWSSLLAPRPAGPDQRDCASTPPAGPDSSYGAQR